ncbi:unnamed protein product [Ectocarpus sp. 12 AP-2014]
MLLFDSLQLHDLPKIHENLCKYLQEKWKASGRKEIDFGEDLLPAVRPEVPQQPNGDDCGVYVIRYAKEVCRLWPTVTKAEVKNGLENRFSGTLFSHTDILDERMLLFELLQKLRAGTNDGTQDSSTQVEGIRVSRA